VRTQFLLLSTLSEQRTVGGCPSLALFEDVMSSPTIEHKIIPLALLDGSTRNYRSHPPEQIAQLKASLERFGAVRSIVVYPESTGRYTILAGHGVVEAARAKGLDSLNCDIAPQSWDMTTRNAYLIADNLHAQNAVDDDSLLAHLLQEQSDAGFDLAALGSDEETLRQMLEALGDESFGQGEEGAGGDEYDTTPSDGPTRTHVGELWQLGKHRLLVGDSTNAEDVQRLMQGEKAILYATDPPYGANAGNIGFTAQRDDIDVITNDDLTDTAMQYWLEQVFRAWVPYLHANAAWYLWHPMLTQGYFAAAAAAADILIHRQIIWVKSQFIFGRGDYHWQHELCFYGWHKGYRPAFYGERNQSTVWEIAWGEKRSEIGHPTAKPLELFAIPMRNHTKQGDLCAEPFAGSGTQIIAAEREGRICYAMELVPRYADICLSRWEAETHQETVLLSRVGVGVKEMVHG